MDGGWHMLHRAIREPPLHLRRLSPRPLARGGHHPRTDGDVAVRIPVFRAGRTTGGPLLRQGRAGGVVYGDLGAPRVWAAAQ